MVIWLMTRARAHTPDRDGKKRNGGVTAPVRRLVEGGFNQAENVRGAEKRMRRASIDAWRVITDREIQRWMERNR